MGNIFISSVSSLSFLFLFLPYPSLSSLLLSLLSLISLFLGDDTKWPTRVDMSLNPNTINIQNMKKKILKLFSKRRCFLSISTFLQNKKRFLKLFSKRGSRNQNVTDGWTMWKQYTTPPPPHPHSTAITHRHTDTHKHRAQFEYVSYCIFLLC